MAVVVVIPLFVVFCFSKVRDLTCPNARKAMIMSLREGKERTRHGQQTEAIAL